MSLASGNCVPARRWYESDTMTYLERLPWISPVLSIVAGTLSAGAGEPQALVSEQTRQELFDAREAAWRSFFVADPAAAIEKSISPAVIAIQQNEERWDNRAHLIAVSRAMQKQNIKLIRIEFPRTEVQLFAETAILYYSYIFETGVEGKESWIDTGRGTEMFVRHDGRWIDVGWHLDNGAFQFKDGRWLKLDEQSKPSAATR